MTDSTLSAPIDPSRAIEKALEQNWKEAIRINSEIIKADEKNIDALNRLAYAYLMVGKVSECKRTYQRVLKLDPYNQIALKNLKKSTSAKKTKEAAMTSNLSPLMFLEEPGKTKIVPLVNLAPDKMLSHLTAGQEVFLKEKRHAVEVRDAEATYLGALPDDLAFKLIKFIAGGNSYNAVIKSIAKNQLIVFLREKSRGKKFANQPSFVTTILMPTTHVEAGEGPDVTPTGEEAEDEIVEETTA